MGALDPPFFEYVGATFTVALCLPHRSSSLAKKRNASLNCMLPSQLACSVSRQVGATYKSLWTKAKQNAQARKAKRTKKRYKGLDKAPTYVSPSELKVFGFCCRGYAPTSFIMVARS